jgi:ferritin
VEEGAGARPAGGNGMTIEAMIAFLREQREKELNLQAVVDGNPKFNSLSNSIQERIDNYNAIIDLLMRLNDYLKNQTIAYVRRWFNGGL